MFLELTRDVVRQLGAKRDLIANGNLSQKSDMLTLVKVTPNLLWSDFTYQITDVSLLDLLDTDYTPEYTEEVLVKDFMSLRVQCGGGNVSVDVPDCGGFEVSVEGDAVDGVSPFSLRAKTVDVNKLRKACTAKKVKKDLLEHLKLKTGKDKLAFLYKKVYNIASVKVIHKDTVGGSVLANVKKFFKLGATSANIKKTTFTVLENTTFAYGLMEITIKDETLGIPPRVVDVKEHKGLRSISSDGSCKKLQQVWTGIKMKARLLQPLALLPESSRCDLLKILSVFLDDRDTLTLLNQTLKQRSEGVFEPPQSENVSSFIRLLPNDMSKESIAQIDAAYLLVGAMGELPDGIPAMLVNCSEEMGVLNLMVSSLLQNKPVSLPDSLPASLQKEGELRWLAELLCLTNDSLNELRQQWVIPELAPEELLELLCLVLQGLGFMQP